MAKPDEQALERLLAEVTADDERTVAFLKDRADDYGLSFGGEKDIKDVPPKLDQTLALIEKWDVRLGDLWQLGEHRLICGDSADAAVVKRLFNGNTAVLMSTDPPYMVDYGGARPSGGGKDWTSKSADILGERDEVVDEKISSVFSAWVPYIRKDAAWFVWHGDQSQDRFVRILTSLGLLIQQRIIWVKPTAIMGYSKYHYRHEPCFFAWMKGHMPYFKQGFYGGGNDTVWTDGFAGQSDVLAIVHDGSDIWEIDFAGKKKPGKNLHPTEKPLELFARPMRNHTRSGEICAEPFSGSGSQILAGEKTGRIVYACEIQPAFVAVALERFLDATGLTPVLLERGPVTQGQKNAEIESDPI